MKVTAFKAVEDAWRGHAAGLKEALDDTLRDVKNLLLVDEHHREGRNPENLQRALGPFAKASFDVNSLSRVLSDRGDSRAMAPDRLKRVKELIPTLSEMKESASSGFAYVGIEEDESEILRLAEEHLNHAAQVFRALRIAQLEIRSKYDAQTHGEMFADFDWRQLGPSELQLCPPFVVVARLDENGSAQLPKIISLLESRMPIKIAALRSSLRTKYSPVAYSTVPPTMTIEALPMAMRGVYFVQTCAAAPEFQQQLFEALTAPRPGVISVLCAHDGEKPEAFQSRAERAVRARAFPLCVYDPNRASGFVECFELSANPSPDALWVTEAEQVFTFAHFAASEPEFAGELTEISANADDLVPMTAYLGLSRRQQIGKRPFILMTDKSGSPVRTVVSPAVAMQCSERLDLWRTLQEISGIDNPHVNNTRTDLQKEFSAEREALLQATKQQMEKDAAERERAAVIAAVRKLVARLADVDPATLPMLAESSESTARG